jgi:hypothetical protein
VISIVTINDEFYKAGRRILKVLKLGRTGVNEAYEVSPHGISSSAPKGTKAVYSETLSNGEKVLLGYLNNQQTGVERGGFKIYSTDDTGNVQTFIYLRPNGQIEFGGNNDFMVRFSALETAYNELQQKFNTHVHPGVTSGGASTSPTPTQSTGDITEAKINDLRIP